VWTTNLVALLLGVGMYSVFAFLPELLQTPTSTGYGFGVSITISGLILLPSSLFMFVLGVMAGPLTKRWGAKVVLVLGLVMGIVAFTLLAVARGHIWEVLASQVVQGIGFGLAFASLSALVVEGVPAHQTGVASGMNANIRTIGGALGASVMSSIVTASARHGGLPTSAGYSHGFALLAIAAAAATVAGFFVPRTRRGPDGGPGGEPALRHGELGMVAAGTLVGDESE